MTIRTGMVLMLVMSTLSVLASMTVFYAAVIQHEEDTRRCLERLRE